MIHFESDKVRTRCGFLIERRCRSPLDVTDDVVEVTCGRCLYHVRNTGKAKR